MCGELFFPTPLGQELMLVESGMASNKFFVCENITKSDANANCGVMRSEPVKMAE
jgi:hypothetical protein